MYQEYKVRTTNYEISVRRNGDIVIEGAADLFQITIPRDDWQITIPRDDWQNVIEDVRAITHLRKRAGDWE